MTRQYGAVVTPGTKPQSLADAIRAAIAVNGAGLSGPLNQRIRNPVTVALSAILPRAEAADALAEACLALVETYGKAARDPMEWPDLHICYNMANSALNRYQDAKS